MAMGSTGTVNVTPEMINSAISAIEEYETTVKSLYSNLESTMSELIPGNFSGSAAQGFKQFFDENITKLADANDESTAVAQIIKLLKEIVNGISDAIPKDNDGLDDQLAEQNTCLLYTSPSPRD